MKLKQNKRFIYDLIQNYFEIIFVFMLNFKLKCSIIKINQEKGFKLKTLNKL